MAKKLEEHLYRSAKSKEDYLNQSTLKKRLQAIAHGLELHRGGDSATSSDAGTFHGSQIAVQQPSGMQPGVGSNASESGQGSNWTAAGAVRLASVESAQGNLNSLAAQLGLAGNIAAQLSSMQQSHANAMGQQGMSNNPIENPASSSPFTSAFSQQNPRWPGGQNGGGGNSSIPQVVTVLPQNQATGSLITSQTTSFRTIPSQEQSSQLQSSGAPSIAPKPHAPMSDQKKKVILQQQQRLLLLRHASKCKAGPACTTKFCEQMVTLWKHMKSCRNKDCKTSHCLSSRCVLNHYRICKSNGLTMTCEVCGPVMLKIRNQERDDGSLDDPLARDQDTTLPTPQPQIPVATASSTQQQHGLSDQAQLLQLQAQQSKLNAQLESLKLLEKQQEELLEQQKSLEEQTRNIKDPSSAQAQHVQEQHVLLHQLQKRCQQQQLLIQQELQMQAPAINAASSSQPPSATAQAGPGNDSAVALRRGSGIGHKRIGKSLSAALNHSEPKESPPEQKRLGIGTKSTLSSKKLKTSKAATAGKQSAKKVEEVAITPLLRMTKEEIQKHLESLNKRIVLSSRMVTHKCRPIIQELLDHKFGWVFKDAVDPVALGLPDYFDVIKNPVHLDLVRKKLENAIYSDMEGCARDTRLVFENAILYNGESSEVGELAQAMLSMFEKSYRTVVKGMQCSLQCCFRGTS